MKLQKLTVGLQQKIGQPNFGSTGASCAVEVVLDEYEAVDGDAIEHRIHQAFARCRKSIDDELKTQGTVFVNRPRPIRRDRSHRPSHNRGATDLQRTNRSGRFTRSPASRGSYWRASYKHASTLHHRSSSQSARPAH